MREKKKRKSDLHSGSSFDSFLEEQGIQEEVEAMATKRVLACGKSKLQALVAVMRKLLHAIFGMFKHNQPFDGSKLFATAPSPPPELSSATP